MTPSLDTKERIRAEAAALFNANGFNGTSMADLARAVGITKSSLYHHYPSKQALLSEIIEVTVNRVTPLVRDVADMDLAVGERLKRAVVLHTVEAIRDRDAIACFVEEGRYLSAEYMATHIANRDTYEQIFHRLVGEGISAGDFVVRDIGVTVKAILGMCNSVVRWYRPDGGHSAAAIAEHFAHIALRAVTAATVTPTDTGGDR